MERLKLWRSGIAGRVADNFESSMKELRRCGHNRSNKSTFVEMGIQLSGFKHALADPQAFAQLVAASRQANSQAYVMPDVQFTVPLHQALQDGMPIYTLNEQGAGQRTIVYLAGGAYLQQPDKTHWEYLNRLAQRTGARVIVPLYPLAPNNNFRAAYQQLAELYVSLYENLPASDITLMGDSAGGGLALGFSEYLGRRGLPQPGHLILFSPWLDLDLQNPLVAKYEEADVTLASWGLRQIGQLWAGDVNHRDYRLSPLYGNLDQVRDIHLVAGTREIMYPDVNALVQKLRDAQIPVDYHVGRRLFHIYPLYQIPEADAVMEMVVKVVNK